MFRARSLALALVGFGLTSGCAARETQASRAAWKQAVRADSTTPGNNSGRADGKMDDPTSDSSAWRDLDNFASTTAELLSLGVSTVPLDTLIAKLCAEPPEASPGVLAPEAVRCPPQPTIEPLGHTLTLELNRHGTIGLAATELSARESLDLLTLSLKYLANSCTGDWTKIPGNATEEFHRCTAPSGSTLVLGRFLSEGGGERWQFSLAVLGPG